MLEYNVRALAICQEHVERTNKMFTLFVNAAITLHHVYYMVVIIIPRNKTATKIYHKLKTK